MVIEIYVDKSIDTENISAEATQLALAAEMEAASRAGLAYQAKHARAELELRQNGFGNPLTNAELKVYREWYPTAYRESWIGTHCACCRVVRTSKSIANYRFDRVPKSVLELIARCRNEFKLDWVEIRTPEQIHQEDPGLFGGKGEHTWLLSRWSETGEHLLTFEDIHSGLQARKKFVNYEGTMLVLHLLTFFATISGLFAFAGNHQLTSYVFGGVALALTVWTWFWARKFKIFRKRFAYAF